MSRTIPSPRRADHVGSLMRPAALLEARAAFATGRIDAAVLERAEDTAIDSVIAMQERVGLPVVTDGEFRRVSWRDGFFENIDGFSRERDEADFAFRLPDGSTQRARPVPRVIARLERRRGIATREFAYLRARTHAVPKITLPAPSVMHFFRGARSIDPAVYPDTREFMRDVSAIYREELAELAALGATYVQFDEVALPILCDPVIREFVAARGDDADRLVTLYIDALNDAVRERPRGLTVAVHMCRGNVGDGIASGGYAPIAERAFAGLDVDGFLLEYDTPRAGDFAPLAQVPKGKTVALGLLSTKNPAVESVDALERRVEAAGRYVNLAQVGLCAQCGFASGAGTRRFDEAVQEAKLARIVEAAERIWR